MDDKETRRNEIKLCEGKKSKREERKKIEDRKQLTLVVTRKQTEAASKHTKNTTRERERE